MADTATFRKGSMSSNEADSENENGVEICAAKLTLPARNEEHRSSNSSLDQDKSELSKEEKDRIIEQAEFYFSDENLRKDGFLLKHVKRNKEGYVNLKLLASFKKMRSLCKDFSTITEILRDSEKLELSDNELKIKRKEPLPKELFETVPVKSVVVSKIPSENPSMDFIAEAFGVLKEKITSLRVVKQGKNYPHDLQSHFARHPELANEIAAVVEFEDAIAVSEIMKMDFSNSSQYQGLSVSLLEMGPKHGKKKKKNEYGDTETPTSDSAADSAASADMPSKVRKKKKDRVSHLAGPTNDDSSSYASSSDGEQGFTHFKSCGKRFDRMHPATNSSNASSASNSPMSSPQPGRRPKQLNIDDSRGSSPAGSPKHPRTRSPLARTTPDRSPLQVVTKLSPLVTSDAANTSSPKSSPEGRGKKNNNNNKASTEQSAAGSPSGQSEWMRRRMMAHAEKSETDKLTVGMRHLEILRQPRGPDGSNGFGSHPMSKFVTVHAC